MMTLYLCGAGNPEGVRLAQHLNRRNQRWGRIVLLDDDVAKQGQRILGVEIVGPFAVLEDASPGEAEVVNLVARTTARRAAAQQRLEAYGLPFAPLVDPDIDLEAVELAGDVIAYRHATLGALTRVGPSSVVFMGGVVGHESVVGRGCVIAANAVLNARVTLGDCVYVGTNATILPDLTIGDGATVGAGSVAVQHVPAGATVMGVPARLLMTVERGRATVDPRQVAGSAAH